MLVVSVLVSTLTTQIKRQEQLRYEAEKDRMRANLLRSVSHDIRTPLTSVLGYLDLLRETTDLPRETLRKYADIAYSKAERLESLINEFFEITRYNLTHID
jgi:two-component system sensor histidine kinase VanS